MPTLLFPYRLPLFASVWSLVLYLSLALVYGYIFVSTMSTAGHITGQAVVQFEGGERVEVSGLKETLVVTTRGKDCKGLKVELVS